ncbi:2-succinyl-5-enolpyruvyl-6-hydroxy-3-cyclohexene-1-carboxylic-acid synthase [Cyclobacterium plantarum]|uniref:2-succinyl-5-enolpyruvyl-6-hydroxy-3-cyclohexene-1-carboxylate synthase n=1 Tax=Cyclobacterium plantarum TaxID=2716263 RepID=A0ABX0HH02_9BACT|nr:2-succinyl-5-enolpyruvyl-6-hydroxy-3-cyclohexene-1-carboxylic-acid synthase [Cyclobacterium plantarum]NHE59666.1 2-succinyl-5-enolpyruvyl-6-hydroxy-3-cyclohexene-1-carboxylic-acid synthase [Cyclobacterium plantarum]
MILPQISHLVSICAKSGVTQAILSPGSRCAPLSLAFIRHPNIHCRTISDERSAAFMALGMAQQLNKPVVLVCTSGSATLNYGPAIAEAFYQQIPLLILTADRPAEWIDQWDGQTIRQQDIYAPHIKGSFTFPDDANPTDKLWHAKRIVKEAIVLAKAFPSGPVHINIPLREPFYPAPGENYNFEITDMEPVLDVETGSYALREEVRQKLKNQLSGFKRILLLPGQQKPNLKIKRLLEEIVQNQKGLLVTDVTSNMAQPLAIVHHDFFAAEVSKDKEMVPDLLISFGKSILSKSLKQSLRNCPMSHWHVQPEGSVPDPFQHLDQIIRLQPEIFLEFLLKEGPEIDPVFGQAWKDKNEIVKTQLPQMLNGASFGELKSLSHILHALPAAGKVHLANSMAVRNVNFLGLSQDKIEIICNRGTSGIDGSNSTAVGCTFTTKELVTLITGDLAFFYDRNAFWHQYNMSNLRIILFNNHGGGIFRMIDGPSNLPELEEYFETRQRLNARLLAREMGFEYTLVKSMPGLKKGLADFFQDSIKPKIIEIESSSELNSRVLKSFRRKIKARISKKE